MITQAYLNSETAVKHYVSEEILANPACFEDSE